MGMRQRVAWGAAAAASGSAGSVARGVRCFAWYWLKDAEQFLSALRVLIFVSPRDLEVHARVRLVGGRELEVCQRRSVGSCARARLRQLGAETRGGRAQRGDHVGRSVETVEAPGIAVLNGTKQAQQRDPIRSTVRWTS